VKRIERHHKIEFFAKPQTANVRRFESKIGPDSGTKVARCKGNHIRGRIDAHDGPFMNTSSNLRRDFAIAASQVQYTLIPFEIEQREHFGGHGLLKSGDPGVSWRVPFGHFVFSKIIP
jgi:hypothetical protein